MLKTLYHGTTLDRFKGITDSLSIIPQAKKGAGSGGSKPELYEGFTFFATSLKVAGDYALWKNKEEKGICVILELTLPEDILLPDDNDCPIAKHWEESADKICQVKVLGSVSVSCINNIYFYDQLEEGYLFELFDLPFQDWKLYFDNKLQQKYKEIEEEKEHEHQILMQSLLDNGFEVENNRIKNQPFFKFLEVYERHDKYHNSYFNGIIDVENGDVYVDINPNEIIEQDKNFALWTERKLFVTYWLFEEGFLSLYREAPRLYDNLQKVFGNVEMYFPHSMSCFLNEIPELANEYALC
jgi:hypothetical protein